MELWSDFDENQYKASLYQLGKIWIFSIFTSKRYTWVIFMVVPKSRGTNKNFAKILPKCENMPQNILSKVSSKTYFFP